MRFFLPLLAFTFSILTVLPPAFAEEETESTTPIPTVANKVQSLDAVLTVTPDKVDAVDENDKPLWHVTRGEPDENNDPTYGAVKGLEFNGVTAKFDIGAVIIVTDPANNPVKITDSTLQLSWSGKKITELEQDAEESAAEHEQKYRITDYGGFGTIGSPLDVLVDNSTIVFNIDKEEPERAWYIDSYNIHIAAGGATANIEKGTVAARTIDDVVDDVSKNGDFTKTGAGTLVIGGASHTEAGSESGLKIGGKLNITGGTVVLAGDRELAVGEREAEGSATTEHHVNNVVIGSGTVLDVNTGGTLKLTNTDTAVADIAIAENGTLRIANSTATDIYNTEKNTVIDVNGGTVEIYAGTSSEKLLADKVDAKLGEKGGTIDVEDGVTFENRSVTGTGNYTKTGEGTHIIKELGIEENIIVTEGTSSLKGGDHQAGRVVIGGSESTEAVLELNGGSWLQLTNTDTAVADIAIAENGTLRVSSAEGTGIFKKDEDDNFMTTNLLVDGGTVEITKGNTDSTESETLLADTIDATLGEKGGTIDVADGVTFENRSVTGTGNYTKTGEGTHIINGFSSEGNLIVTAGTTVLNNITENSTGTFKTSPDHPFLDSEKTWIIQEAGRIEVTGTGAVLDITAGTTIELTHADGGETAGKDAEGKDEIDVKVADEGTLKIAASNETLLFHSRGYTNILNDGGTIEIYKKAGDTEITMDGSSINTIVGSKGGTFDIDAGVTLIGGTVTALGNKADVKKIGGGTSRVGDVNIGTGVYDVQQGTAEFAGSITAGSSLKGAAGTTINMVAVIDEDNDPKKYEFAKFDIAGTFDGGKHNVTAGEGKVTGTLKNIGTLTAAGAFDLGSGTHNVDRLVVSANAFDLKAGAWLQLTNTDAEVADMEVKGVLKIASAEGTGIFKKDIEGNYISTNLLIDGGAIEIYKLEEGGKNYLLADTIHTTLGASGGGITVAEGLTFESGSITSATMDTDDNKGYYTKQGKGTHTINGLDITGTVQAQAGKIILQSGDGTGESAVGVTVAKDAVFEVKEGVSLNLSNALTIQSSGLVIHNGILTTKSLDIAGGTLQLQLTPTELLEGETIPAVAITTESISVTNGGKITVGNEQLPLGSYTYENIVEVKSEMTDHAWDQTLAELNKNQTALYRSVWGRSTVEGSTSDFLTLTMRQLTFNTYLNEVGWRQRNALAAAGMIDTYINALHQGEQTEEVVAIRNQLAAMDSADILAECRGTMASELIGDAARMVMSSPYRMVFQQLNAMPAFSRTANRVELGQVNPQARVRFWFNPYAQSEEGDADDNTYDGYSLTRVGFMLGGDVNITNRTTLGLVLNYGNPNIDNALGEVSANDFMIGAYARVPLFWHISTNAMIGYGVQQYSYEGAGGTSDFDGDSIFGSLELVRPFQLMTIVKWTPVIGLDFQSIGMDDLTVGLHALGRMPISPEGMDSVSVRIGLRGEMMRFRTRVQYLRQLSGDDYMMSSMSLSNVASARIPSVQWGKDWVNVGFGGELIQSRQFRLFADYDLDISKNTTSHLGSLSAVLTW